MGKGGPKSYKRLNDCRDEQGGIYQPGGDKSFPSGASLEGASRRPWGEKAKHIHQVGQRGQKISKKGKGGPITRGKAKRISRVG